MAKETQIQARHMPRENHEDGLGWKRVLKGREGDATCALKREGKRTHLSPVIAIEFILLDHLNALARTKASCSVGDRQWEML